MDDQSPSDDQLYWDDPASKDNILAAALASGLTQRKAGEVAHVSERTVRRRMLDPTFRLKVTAFHRQALREAKAGMVALLPKALDTIADVLDHGKDEVRLRAAQTVLDLSKKYHAEAENQAFMDMGLHDFDLLADDDEFADVDDGDDGDLP